MEKNGSNYLAEIKKKMSFCEKYLEVKSCQHPPPAITSTYPKAFPDDRIKLNALENGLGEANASVQHTQTRTCGLVVEAGFIQLHTVQPI